jgi:hypothetical protein
MTNEAKVLGISMISILMLSVFVAPLAGDESTVGINELQPPDHTVLSDDFDPGDGIFSIAGWVAGIVSTIVWFFSTVGAVIFNGYTSGPLLATVNFVFTVVGLVAFIKLMPYT